jgi:hypothetical protein
MEYLADLKIRNKSGHARNACCNYRRFHQGLTHKG